jgi:hypothetical protein
MRGTGPGARKRLQQALRASGDSDTYVKLYLTQEEARLIYEGLRGLPAEIGTRDGAIIMNILYRITEQVMMHPEVESRRSIARSKKRQKG